MLRSFRPYRMLRTLWTMLSGVARYRWLMWRNKHPRLRPSKERWEQAHATTGTQIYRLASSLGGGYIKFAQVLGARTDFFPASFLAPLRRLHDQVPPRRLETLMPHVERELGRPFGEIFAHFEPEPLAAASLAQVHRATLTGGEAVAVKIQYPEARRLFPSDMASLQFTARVIHAINRGLNLRPLAREIGEFVKLELDFGREKTSTLRVRDALRTSPFADVQIPGVFEELSTDRLLVVEFLEGTPLSRLDLASLSPGEREAVARKIADLYAWMIFDLEFFHGDPHPGNILVGAGGRVSLLDFGLARQLPAGFAAGVARMIAAGMVGDARATVVAAESVGFRIGGQKPEEFLHLIKMLLGDYKGSRALLDVVAAAPLQDIPPHFALIVRTFVLLNGISETLAPGQRLIASSVARSLLPKLKNPDREAAGAMR